MQVNLPNAGIGLTFALTQFSNEFAGLLHLIEWGACHAEARYAVSRIDAAILHSAAQDRTASGKLLKLDRPSLKTCNSGKFHVFGR